MAVRSVFALDVDSTQFDEFQRKFDAYRAAVKALPTSWNASNTAARAASETFANAVETLTAQNNLLHKAAIETSNFGRVSSTVATGWRGLAHEARAVSHHIIGATASMLKWPAIVSAMTGALGIGGLFGLDSLARSAAGARRSAQGLGLSIGEQAAFQTDFGQYVNAPGMLAGVNAAMTDITKRWSLYGAGLSESALAGKSTGAVAAELLPKIKAIVDSTPTAQLAQVLQARGLSEFISVEDARRLRSMTPAELTRQENAYAHDARSMQPARGAAKSWQEFAIQLDRARNKIWEVFVTDLAPLEPGLLKFSAALVKTVDSVMKAPVIGQLITEAAGGLKEFAAYIGTPAFQKNISEFVTGVGQLAATIAAAVKWISGVVPGAKKAADATSAATFIAATAAAGYVVAGAPGAAIAAAGATSAAIEAGRVRAQARKGYYVSPDTGIAIPVPPGASAWGLLPHAIDRFKQWWSGGPTAQQTAFLRALEPGEGGKYGYNALYGGKGSAANFPVDKYGFPIWPGVRLPKGQWTHAAGAYQFQPGTWDPEAKKLGLHDFSPRSQDIAAWDLASSVYQRRTGHSLADALAHGGNAAEIARVLKDQWTSMNSSAFVQRLNRDLAETRRGGPNRRVAARDRAAQGRVAIDIRNSTGGSAVVTGSQLA